MTPASRTVWERLMAFGERNHRFCIFLCIAEALIFTGILIGLVLR